MDSQHGSGLNGGGCDFAHLNLKAFGHWAQQHACCLAKLFLDIWKAFPQLCRSLVLPLPEGDEILLARMLFEEAARGGAADLLAMVLVLVDIKKAYPNVPRSLCWKVFRRLGVPALHESTAYVVRTGNGDSEVYGLQRGLREGCPSSCQVYNIFHNVTLWALRKWLPTTGVPHLARPDAPLPRRRTEEAEEGPVGVHLLAVLADDGDLLLLLLHLPPALPGHDPHQDLPVLR